MSIKTEFDETSIEYSGKGKCLEAARELTDELAGKVEKILIINSVASSEDKFENRIWPFHALVVGFDQGLWFGGAPGSGELHVDSELKKILEMLVAEFGGIWPSADEIEKAMAEGKKELKVYADDLVC
jgi:hypothetical protein